MDYLRADNLYFSYGKNKECVLCGLNLTIEQNGIYILLGRNGSGKTTFLEILIKYLLPQKGTVFIEGKEISAFNLSELSKKVSFLESELPYIPLIVSEILSWGMFPYKKHFDAGKISNELNLTQLLDKNFNHLSTGEKKRVLLGRVFVQNTKIVLIDEPFNFLDPYYRIEIAKMLKTLSRERVVLITTHDLGVAAYLGSEIFLIHQGRIFARKTREDLFSGSELYEAFGIDEGLRADFEEFYRLR